MTPLLKIALGAVLAALIVRYTSGRGAVLRTLIEGATAPKDVPIVHPEGNGKFDSEIAPGAPF